MSLRVAKKRGRKSQRRRYGRKEWSSLLPTSLESVFCYSVCSCVCSSESCLGLLPSTAWAHLLIALTCLCGPQNRLWMSFISDWPFSHSFISFLSPSSHMVKAKSLNVEFKSAISFSSLSGLRVPVDREIRSCGLSHSIMVCLSNDTVKSKAKPSMKPESRQTSRNDDCFSAFNFLKGRVNSLTKKVNRQCLATFCLIS